MIQLKFTGWYSYTECLVKLPGGADGPGVYVFGIYADKLQRVIPMYVGESSESSIWDCMHNRHIGKHTGTYRVFNLKKIISDPKGDHRFYRTLFAIAWQKINLANTKLGYFQYVKAKEPKTWKIINDNTVYENNADYLNARYGHIKPITGALSQHGLIQLLHDQTTTRSFIENWQLFFTRFWFSFVPVPSRIQGANHDIKTTDLESLVHRHLAERIRKNMALEHDRENRTTLLGRITGQKLPVGDCEININSWFDGEIKASDLLK